MSNLLKSKFLLGVMTVAVMFVGFAVVSNTASAQQADVSASDIQYAATVRSGSSGQASLIWQKFLNGYSSANLVADGKFGPLSTSALKVWQSSRSLGVDGVAGPMSRASAVAQINSGVTVPVGGNFPAGCSSASGYSVTTGMPCTSAMTYPAGCTSGAGYSVTTGMPCSGGANLPAGCSSTAGYSPTTGAKCDSGGSTPSNPSGPLMGGAGSISVTLLSDYSAEEVGEGENDVPVLAFDVEADDDSDVEINSIKVEFAQNTVADSDKLDDYASEVSVWFGGKKVGSSTSSSFNESSDVYSRSISVTGLVIRAGDEEKVTVAVSALSNLDSGDIDTDQWNVGVSSIRFTDGDNVVTTDSYTLDTTDALADDTLEKLFDFEDFAGATDVELKAALDDDSINEGHILDVDDTDDTTHEILSFTLEAEGDSDIWVDEIPFVITTTGETNESLIITKAELWMGSTKIGTETVPAGGVVVFDDLDMTIDAGDEETFTLSVELQDTTGALDDGDTVQATLTVASIDAEDEAGDSLASGDLTGTAIGEAHEAREAGIMVEFVSSNESRTFTADDAGEFDQGVFNITFDVTAFDADQRIDFSCIEDQADAAGQGAEYTITNAGSNATTCVLTSNTTDTEDTANTKEVDEDTTRRFTLSVTATSSADAYAEVSLASINWGSATNDTNANYYTFNLNDYKTGAIFLNTF